MSEYKKLFFASGECISVPILDTSLSGKMEALSTKPMNKNGYELECLYYYNYGGERNHEEE